MLRSSGDLNHMSGVQIVRLGLVARSPDDQMIRSSACRDFPKRDRETPVNAVVTPIPQQVWLCLRSMAVRFTVLATSENNRYEPCLDELEIFTAGPDRRNVALASTGAKVRSSGNYRGGTKHRLENLPNVVAVGLVLSIWLS